MTFFIYLLLSQTIHYNQNGMFQESILPTLREAFPEINNIWPIWVKKQGFKIACNKDEDCLFPQACCHHPIIPGEKFCCKGGYKTRQLQYAFIVNK